MLPSWVGVHDYEFRHVYLCMCQRVCILVLGTGHMSRLCAGIVSIGTGRCICMFVCVSVGTTPCVCECVNITFGALAFFSVTH